MRSSAAWSFTSSLVLLLGLFAIAGCATTVGTIAPDHRLGTSEGSVVVGRVEAVRGDGRPFGNMPRWFYGRMLLTAVHEASGEEYRIRCDEDGYSSDFYVSLPSGRYQITRWNNPAFKSNVRASFDVPSQGVVIYIGTLRWTDTGQRDFLSQGGVWTVHDDADASLRAFQDRFPTLGDRVTRSPALLMRLTR